MIPEREPSPLPQYQPSSTGDERTTIVRLSKPEQVTGFATPERVVGRKILQWNPNCGSIDSGGPSGPGFFGLQLEASGQLPEEWLILTLWAADGWLELNGRLVSTLYGNDAVGVIRDDEITPFLTGKALKRFEVGSKGAILGIDGAILEIQEDPNKRPLTAMSHELRALGDGEDLRKAWIISPVPWV